MAESRTPQYQLFSSTEHPISRESRLWRYLTFEKFVWLLEKSKLYHSRLDLLGDPFEGSVTRAYVRKRDAGQLPKHLQTAFPEYEATEHKRWMYSRFVTSWYASPHESAAMRKLYSRERAGVAIVSTPLRMQEGVDLTPYHTAILGPVEYLDFEKEDGTLPFGKKARPGFLKRKSFEHEKEVRGMIYFEEYPQDPNLIRSPEYVQSLRESRPPGIDVRVELKRLIQEIYISPLSAAYFRDVVSILTDRHGLADLIHPSALLGDPVY